MVFQRGDIVLIPFPYTDLSASKTRPAVVISSERYHTTRTELLLAYISSQIPQANPTIDYVLSDWSVAGLLKPSFVRPKIAAIEPALIAYKVGTLSPQDLLEVDRCLRRALGLNNTALSDIVAEVDLTTQPANIIQEMALKSVKALISFASRNNPDVDLDDIRRLLLS